MKCPKCGYLGFETTDRCRNCQYDFSLTAFSNEPDLTLHGSDRNLEAPSDFDLPAIKRHTDRLSNTALDLDRLFGAPETRITAEPPLAPMTIEPPPEPVAIAPEPVPIEAMSIETEPEPELRVEPEVEALPYRDPEPEPDPDIDSHPESDAHPELDRDPDPGAVRDSAQPSANVDDAALPFDDAPIMPPPAARTPLAVRRSTPEVPRNRPRTTRPIRTDSLNFEAASSPKDADAARAASETVASLLEMPSVGVRVGAGLIDLALLAGISATVLYLTLRVTGLQNSLDDLRVLPLIPFVGFLGLVGFGYVAAFTVAGGQTIGKMVFNLRVIGDDGRPVDAAGGMLRALGCMLVPITLGLSYLPVLFASDHRALHDRLAGTRVVQE